MISARLVSYSSWVSRLASRSSWSLRSLTAGSLSVWGTTIACEMTPSGPVQLTMNQDTLVRAAEPALFGLVASIQSSPGWSRGLLR